MHRCTAPSLLPVLHCQPPLAATIFASSLQLSFMCSAVQRPCSVSWHSSLLALSTAGIALPVLLPSCRCMRRQANFRCCSLLSSVTFCLASPSLLLACSSLPVRCMQLSSLQFYCDALALHCCCRCASNGDRRCRAALPEGNFLLLPLSLPPQCLFASHSCMCSLLLLSALACCALLLCRSLPACARSVETRAIVAATVYSCPHSPTNDHWASYSSLHPLSMHAVVLAPAAGAATTPAAVAVPKADTPTLQPALA